MINKLKIKDQDGIVQEYDLGGDNIDDTQVSAETTWSSEKISNEAGMHNYSTEEHVVGTWIDGKPIYRKLFTINLAWSSGRIDTKINWTDNHFSKIIKCDAYYISDQYINYYPCYAGAYGWPWTLAIQPCGPSATITHLMIEYTKSTD